MYLKRFEYELLSKSLFDGKYVKVKEDFQEEMFRYSKWFFGVKENYQWKIFINRKIK